MEANESLLSSVLRSMLNVASSPSALVFCAGGISGVVEGVSVQPLEMIKTRFQLNTGAPLGFGQALRQLYREGGVLQLYRGGLPEITGAHGVFSMHAGLALS